MRRVLGIYFFISICFNAIALELEFDLTQITSVYKLENIYRDETDLYSDWKLGVDAYYGEGDVQFIGEANVYYGIELSYDIERLLIEVFLGDIVAISIGRQGYDSVETINEISPVLPIIGTKDGLLSEVYIGSDGTVQAGLFIENSSHIKDFNFHNDILAVFHAEHFFDPLNIYAGTVYDTSWSLSAGLSVSFFDAVIHADYMYKKNDHILDSGFIWDMYPNDDLHISLFSTFIYQESGSIDNTGMLELLKIMPEPDFHDPFDTIANKDASFMASRYITAGFELSIAEVIGSNNGVIINIDDQSSVLHFQLIKPFEDWLEISTSFVTKTGSPFEDELASTPWEYYMRMAIQMYI